MSDRPLNRDCSTCPRGDCATSSPTRSLAYSATPAALNVLTNSRRFIESPERQRPRRHEAHDDRHEDPFGAAFCLRFPEMPSCAYFVFFASSWCLYTAGE